MNNVPLPLTSALDAKQFAAEFELLLSKMSTMLSTRIQTNRSEVGRISSLSLLDEAGERDAALAPTRQIVEAYEAQQDEMKKEKIFTPFISSPFQYTELLLDLRAARGTHEQARLAFDNPSARIARMDRINRHNTAVQAELDTLLELRERVQHDKATLDVLTAFQTKLAPAIAAAKGDGWKSPDFLQMLSMVKDGLAQGGVSKAEAYVAMLRFQSKPDERTYKSWTGDANKILDKANGSNSGFVISRAYSEVAERSNRLARAALAPQLTSLVGQHPHPSDQWQFLAALFTDPRAMQTDALWTIYWAMFQFSQGMSDALKRTDLKEDILNGKAAEKMSRMFADWAAPRLEKFGYPKTTSYVGALEIAGSTEESRLGADLGIIIDINIGGLKCKKVALIQAKKAHDGKANIGSDKRQLSKLIATPNLGYYIFYHQSSPPLFAQLPTVCAAATLAEQETILRRGIDAKSLTISVRELGWDWTNFMTFGLCLPDTEIGAPFSNVEDAFSILGGGSPEHLPKYLQVICVSDPPSVLELENRVHERYREFLVSRENAPPERSSGPRMR